MNISQFVGELILSKHSKPVDVNIHTGSFKLLQIYVSSLTTGVHHSVSGLAHWIVYDDNCNIQFKIAIFDF